MLNSAKIEYLLVGGYAVSYYGYPRPTGDLDVWIATTPENVSKVLRALDAFGFGSAGATPDLFLSADRVVRMGVPPVRIELLTAISGVEFDACRARKVDAVFDGVPVSLISRDDLIANKRAAGRPKDLNDIAHLLSPPPTADR